MTKTGVIGKGNALPWHYPGDLRFFKERTQQQTILMGRRTWQSLGCTPLPYRHNIIVSRSMTSDGGPASVVSDINRVSKDSWCIGGGSLYAACMDQCDHLVATLVPDEIVGDNLVYFPAYALPWESVGKTRWKRISYTKHPYEKGLHVFEAWTE